MPIHPSPPTWLDFEQWLKINTDRLTDLFAESGATDWHAWVKAQYRAETGREAP